jgi:hypothetical protein
LSPQNPEQENIENIFERKSSNEFTSSVSVGKPHITSVAMVTFGTLQNDGSYARGIRHSK